MVTKRALVTAMIVGGLFLLGRTITSTFRPDNEQRILDSSLMITMTVPELETAPQREHGLPIPPDEYQDIAKPKNYIEAEGLGTLVTASGELLIITHDHWSVYDSQLGIVQIKDGRGQSLVELEMHQFKRLVRFRDGGTMILSAPEGLARRLQGVQFNALADSSTNRKLTAGDRVNLVYRQRNGEAGVAVMQVEVESIGQKRGLPVVRLDTLEGLPIVGGDSGGGIWLDGQLVANTWTTILIVDGETGESRPADSGIAALINSAIG